MVKNRTEALVEIATKTGMTPKQAVALPVAVSVFAKRAGMTETAMLTELLVNGPLRTYLAEVCTKSTS